MGNVRRAKARRRAARASSDGGRRSIRFPIRRRRSRTSRSSWRGDWRAASSSRTTRASTTRSSKPSSRVTGIAFDAPVLCTVMLSRRLYPSDRFARPRRADRTPRSRRMRAPSRVARCARAQRVLVRNGAGTGSREDCRRGRRAAGRSGDAGAPRSGAHRPVAGLSRASTCFTASDEEILRIGEARNLRWHLSDYFRLDRASAQCHGDLASDREDHVARHAGNARRAPSAYRVRERRRQRVGTAGGDRRSHGERRRIDTRASSSSRPDAARCPRAASSSGSSIPSARRAMRCFALSRQHALCHAMLGIAQSPRTRCVACADARVACGEKTERLRHLVKCFVALRPLRVSPWPYRGPVVVRERRDLHVFDEWRHLGTVKTESEVRETMNVRPGEFDKAVYACLARRLPKVASARIHCAAERDTNSTFLATSSSPSDAG